MDADLQDPPEVVIELVERWEAGAREPTRVAEVTKTLLDGSDPFPRLPVPHDVCGTFEDLSQHLDKKSIFCKV